MSARSGKLDGVTFLWLDAQPRGRVSVCDKCSRRVWPEEPRMQYHDGKGKFTSKGTSSSYWCMDCASRRGIIPPEREQKGIQGDLFNE